MAKNARKLQAVQAVETDEPRTGLGETMEEIEAKAGEGLRALVALVKLGAKCKLEDLAETAYQYGLVEKRRRRLARRTKGGAAEGDE